MQPKIKRIIVPGIFKILFLAVAFLFILGIGKIVFWGQELMRQTGLTPIVLVRLFAGRGTSLPSQDGKTTILLLGVGGGSHDGADLTDTILLLSLDIQKKKIAMISVPRDLWSDTLQDKINSAYHYGEEKKNGGGLTLAKVTVEDVTGLPIHRVLLIDFSGFEDVIDAVGGVDVWVPQAFTDPEFPVAGRENDSCGGNDPAFACRYESVTFSAGLQHMDGERSLVYVRSRHAQGEEGSDFARGKRQQEVFAALMEQLKKPSVWLNPSRIVSLLSAFDRATSTDMRISDIAEIAKAMMLSTMDGGSIKRISFIEYLKEPPLWMYGRYTLVPKESFEAIHEYIKASLH
jgi:LCP family protein required for cell wall assembly